MARQKKDTAKASVKKDEFDRLIDRLEKTVDAAQVALDKAALNDEIGLVAFAKVAKIISDTLQRIYQIRFGKAAQEETLQMIADLQKHFAMAEAVSAERERRTRQKPLVEVVGDLYRESEIGVGIETEEEDTTARAIHYQEEHQAELQQELDEAVNNLEDK